MAQEINVIVCLQVHKFSILNMFSSSTKMCGNDSQVLFISDADEVPGKFGVPCLKRTSLELLMV